MGHIIISPIYHPIYLHFPIHDPDRGKPEKPRKRLIACSRFCSYYCSKHEFSSNSKQEMRDHLRNSEDHSI